MTRATKQYHDPDTVEQLSLLSHWELAVLRSSASRPRQGELASRKARRLQDVKERKERFIQGAGATQLKFPGF